MPIPDFQLIMAPLLRLAATSPEKEITTSAAVEHLAKEFNLSPQEKERLLPSGRQPIFSNRVGWATTYFKKAGLLEAPKRGSFRITERGLQLFKQNLQVINTKLLKQYPEFVEFHQKQADANDKVDEPIGETRTPEEVLDI